MTLQEAMEKKGEEALEPAKAELRQLHTKPVWIGVKPVLVTKI